MRYFSLCLIFLLSFDFALGQTNAKRVIELSLNQVIGISKSENLTLKSKQLEYNTQNLEVWKSYSYFLPTFSYQAIATNNVELPVFVFMGMKFTVGTKYAFQHALDLTLPLYTGGSRWFNSKIQTSLKKSLAEELKGKEQEVVLQALQAYCGIMLSNSLYQTTSEAVNVAKANFEQVEKFYNAGTATEFDLQRAKAQYLSTLPQLEKAKAEKTLSIQRLKFLLNLEMSDSIVIKDTLETKDFLSELKFSELNEYKSLSKENRFDIKSLQHKLEATEQGEMIALGKFTPTVAVSANVAHQAQLENSNVRWDSYIRSKSISLSLIMPLFEGGRKIIEYQQAKIQTEQMKIALTQVDRARLLDVEENFYKYNEAIKNLESLKEAMFQSNESLRLSNLLYNEGMSTQLDVLNAQLLKTSSTTQYFQGIFDYNLSQLSLLYSVGILNRIWE